MKPTRKHILDHALTLFNEKGFVNVRLQHIADAAFVSVGHLAYHFKNKDAIIEELYDELRIRQEELLNEFRIVPLFEDINRYLTAVYGLQHRYIFFYLDTLEIFRAYPHISERHRVHLLWRRSQLGYMIDFNVARGSFRPLSKEQARVLVVQMNAVMDTWIYSIRTQFYAAENRDEFIAAFWALTAPYFTDMGQREYEQL